MSRNRMKNSQSLHWMGVVKWVLILGLMSLLGLSYMFCKNQNLRLADETMQLKHKYEAIMQRNNALWLDLEYMKSPDRLARRLVQMHSTLLPISDPRIVGHVARMEGQSTRMTLARMGTVPKINLIVNPVGAVTRESASPELQH